MFIFLVARPLTPLPPLGGRATKKKSFFGFPYLYVFYQKMMLLLIKTYMNL